MPCFFRVLPDDWRYGKPRVAGWYASGKLEFIAFWAESSSCCAGHWALLSIFVWLKPNCKVPSSHPTSLLVHGCCTAAISTNSKLLPGGASAASLCWPEVGQETAVAIRHPGGGRQLMRLVIPCMVDSSQSTTFWCKIISKREVQSKPYRFCKSWKNKPN